jgi:hypothetical protein
MVGVAGWLPNCWAVAPPHPQWVRGGGGQVAGQVSGCRRGDPAQTNINSSHCSHCTLHFKYVPYTNYFPCSFSTFSYGITMFPHVPQQFPAILLASNKISCSYMFPSNPQCSLRWPSRPYVPACSLTFPSVPWCWPLRYFVPYQLPVFLPSPKENLCSCIFPDGTSVLLWLPAATEYAPYSPLPPPWPSPSSENI